MTFSLRELAAIDLVGRRGSRLRRALVLVEFPCAAVLGLAVGAWLVASGGFAGMLLGVWFVGIGADYAVLTFHAVQLIRRDRLLAVIGRLDDLEAERRRYSWQQALLFVPFLPAVAAIQRSASRRPR